MAELNAYDYVFPVVGGDHVRQTGEVGPHSMRIREAYGTAFCLAENFFITNEHVIRNASANPSWGIGFIENESWKAVTSGRYDLFSDFDIGILSAPVPNAKNLKWHAKGQAMLTEVHSSGFPYALDLSAAVLLIRSFQGTVVTTRTWNGLSAKPRIYELSFPCPRGLSGAPLWKTDSSLPVVVGVIFGNAITEMIVNTETERTKDGAETTIYEKVEALHLGMAIQTHAILSIESPLLGTTIGEFLRKNSLLETV